MLQIKMPVFPGGKQFTVGKINVKEGDTVSVGDELLQVETKKGNRPVKATSAGKIEKILASEGEEKESGTVLMEMTEEAGAPEGQAAETASAKELPKTERHAQLLIIGGGIGGYVSAIYASRKGKKAVLVEMDKLGGTCLNRGCIPTKSFIASSEHVTAIKESGIFGIQTSQDIKVDMGAIVKRKDQVVDRLVGGVDFLMNKNNIEVIKGSAHFTDDSHVSVVTDSAENIFTFDDCIIATGSSVAKPPIKGIDSEGVMDSTALLDCKDLPESISIIGGGVIGLKFAFMYRNLGVPVTVIEFLDRLVTVVDKEASEEIRKMAVEKGIKVELGAKVEEFIKDESGHLITVYEKDGNKHYVVSEKVLVATGRKPNTEGLGLENTKIEMNDRQRGIKVDSHMKTSVNHIYAVGDVNNVIQLAHAASHEGVVAVDNITGKASKFDRSKVPSVIFTKPEIATVGLSEDEAKKEGIQYKTGVFHYSGNGKALTMHETEGYIKLLSDKEGKILGGTIVGADASTLIASVTLAVQNSLTAEDIADTIFAHPTTAEVVHEAALDLTIGAFHE